MPSLQARKELFPDQGRELLSPAKTEKDRPALRSGAPGGPASRRFIHKAKSSSQNNIPHIGTIRGIGSDRPASVQRSVFS